MTRLPPRLKLMPDAAKLLWTKLAEWSGRNGHCWWTQVAMAEEMGWSARKVWSVLKSLAKAELLTVTRRGLGKPSLYAPVGIPVQASGPAVDNVFQFASPDSQIGCESFHTPEIKTVNLQAGSAFPQMKTPPEKPKSNAELLEEAFPGGCYDSRGCPVPAFRAIQDRLRAAQHQSRAARNPEAYERAIILDALGIPRKPPARESASAPHSWSKNRNIAGK